MTSELPLHQGNKRYKTKKNPSLKHERYKLKEKLLNNRINTSFLKTAPDILSALFRSLF